MSQIKEYYWLIERICDLADIDKIELKTFLEEKIEAKYQSFEESLLPKVPFFEDNLEKTEKKEKPVKKRKYNRKK